MKINLQNYTKDRCTWMLFEFQGHQRGIVWDNQQGPFNPEILFMDHPLGYAKRTRESLNSVIIYI